MDKLILLPPPLVALALAGAGVAVDRLLLAWPVLALPLLGLLLIAVGLLLLISSAVSFRRFRTTIIPHGDPAVLITAGPYLWTRNPIYLALLTVLSGFALYFGGLALFLAPPAFYAVIGRVHIPHEEAKLSARFGETYGEYRQRVACWL